MVESAHEAGLHTLPAYADGENIAGYGTRGKVDGQRIAVGNLDLMRREGVSLDGTADAAGKLASAGWSVIAVASDGRFEGLIALADVVRPAAVSAVAGMKRLGIEVALLTGDNVETAQAVAAQVGIERVFAGVKPADKADLRPEAAG